MGVILTTCCEKGFVREDDDQPMIEVRTSQAKSDSARRILSFKDFKGFKKVQDIQQYYKFYEMLGKGTFGEVLRAEHRKANVECAVKRINKKQIQEH
jgi:serine/threonine protein kinase